jgi:O-methyltransferase involved in polyketide biosynthesis
VHNPTCNDPIVLAHAHQLVTSTPEGACAYIYGDLREPDAIVRQAASTLDFGRPTAVMLFGILHFLADADGPGAIVARLAAALAPGSYLAVTHLAGDVHGAALTETFGHLNPRMDQSVILRDRAEVAGLLDGLELVDPGVVELPRWRPDPGAEAPAGRALPMWCAVGRKP